MTAIATKGAALLAVGLFSLVSVSAHAKRVNVKGQAATVPGDPAATLRAVKRDARRKAVEAGAGVMVKSNSIVRNYQMVSDEIATSSMGVITNEQFSKMTEANGVASISLTADVSPSAVEDAICTVIKANHDPRIAFAFVEHLDGHVTSNGPLDALLTQSLLDNCFTLVATGTPVRKLATAGEVPQELMEQAVQNANAQYLLVGTGSVKSSRFGYAFTANLRLINLATHQVEANASTTASSSSMHLTPNSENQGLTGFRDRMMDQLLTAIAKRWMSDLVNTSSVVVEVTNVQKFKHMTAFKNEVTAAFQDAVVQHPKLRRGKATMVVDGIAGGADAFAARMQDKTVLGLNVDVAKVAPGKVVLTLTE